MSLEYHDLSDAQAGALLKLLRPLPMYFRIFCGNDGNARTVQSIPLRATPETLAEPKHTRLEVLLSTDTEFRPIEMDSLLGAAYINDSQELLEKM